MSRSELYRAGARHSPGFEALQRDAFAKNRDILGVEPLPLLVDASEIIAGKEVWLIGNDKAPDAALVLDAEDEALLIWSLAVASRSQGRGLGNILLAFAEQRAVEQGLSALTLYTGEPLADNIAWYARHGFRITGVEALSDRRIVHMKKSIRQ